MKLAAFFLYIVICFFMAFPVSASNRIIVGGSGADLETFRILAREFQKLNPSCEIDVLPSIGSGGAVRGVKTGRVDIGLMSRPLKEKEKAKALSTINYANTAMVFVVARNYPVSDIDTNALKSIYLGQDHTSGLKPILRPRHDSDTQLLLAKLPQIKDSLNKAYERKGVPVGITDQSTMDLLLQGNAFIITSTLSLIQSEKPPVNVLSLNGIAPSSINISNGSYPLVKKLFILYAGDLTTDEKNFVEFIKSEKGTEILKATGHVPAVR